MKNTVNYVDDDEKREELERLKKIILYSPLLGVPYGGR